MKTIKLLLLSMAVAYSTSAVALPDLQLGPDASNPGAWTYDLTETWVVNESSFNLNAYALDSAWDASISSGYAYLIAAAVPSTSNATVAFDINVGGASMVASGFGAPPIEDPNTPSPHNVYDTYYQVYEFMFDRTSPGLIGNVEPGNSGEDTGYSYSFDIDINSMLEGVDGVHFDLFTVSTGQWDSTNTELNKDLVQAIAPYSHDAEYNENCTGACTHNIPEPTMLALLAAGLLGVAVAGRRQTRT